jgi:hypothetical protein
VGLGQHGVQVEAQLLRTFVNGEHIGVLQVDVLERRDALGVIRHAQNVSASAGPVSLRAYLGRVM